MDYATEYINSGVLVFSPGVHRPAFEAARCLHGITAERSWEVCDQCCLGLGIKWSGTPLHLLPPEFNRCGDRMPFSRLTLCTVRHFPHFSLRISPLHAWLESNRQVLTSRLQLPFAWLFWQGIILDPVGWW